MYKIKLTETEINKIYEISDKKSTQASLMSILSYLIKYTDKTTNTLTKSLNKLYKMYLRYHNKLTKSYFYTLVSKLKDKNLLSFAPVEDKKEETFEEIEKVPVSIENTDLNQDSELPNNLIINNTNTYTLNTTSVVNAVELLDDVFRDLKIKSKVIKTLVLAKLQNTVLDAKGAINYIIRVITEKTEQYNTMRVNYAKAVAKTKYYKSKNTFVAATKKLKFDNFEAREYDYNSLEQGLLGLSKI
ncbi:hypothetical protein [Clostridium botulinum]|uniref:hypothetical protein n=1 Tax=Clostridium botulinum TaxID=1491 RepID=UPI00196742CC|nr:hypothetical protein [Clostridium botulinum]MBN1079248.1 hypothetical protein [Clostridium botulinum]